MSDDISINREALLKLLNLVRPSLSTLDYLPILQHIRIADGELLAHNDISAISARIPDLELGCCVPGEVLIRALGSFNAEKVMLQPDEKGSTILVVSGRSKVKVPTMALKDFPFTMPEATKKTPVLKLAADVLVGIQRCLISVGNDPTHPATMGVTLDQEDGHAVLYATDNVTISRFETRSEISLPGDAPIILPTFFCEQLISLAKQCDGAVELELHPGALVAIFYDKEGNDQITLFTKVLVDLVPLEFNKIINRYCKLSGIAAKMHPIPASFDAAFSRALLVLSAERDKATKISSTDSALKLLSTSAMGEATDTIAFDGASGETPDFHIDPSLVARALKPCTEMGLFKQVMVLGDEKAQFIHLIAHCTA